MDKNLAEAAKYAVEIELLTRAWSNLWIGEAGVDRVAEERGVILQRLRILLDLP